MMLKSDILNKLSSDTELRITHLRKDVLSILLSAKKPLTAYEILASLKKKRPNAEPPTVYRVLDYLLEKKLIHKIQASNQYICCSHLTNFKAQYHGILFLCDLCAQAFEFIEEGLRPFIEKLSSKRHFEVSNSLIEIKGICQKCLKKPS
jgi:Fur family transcriptional regulator, zinc uptake regulator